MPTPRPIIETRIGVTVLMSVRPARMNSSRNAVTSARDRERDRDEHRHERAEDDQQDDDRREQAERLRRALLDRRELGLAVVLDRHAGRLRRPRGRSPRRRRPGRGRRPRSSGRTAPPRRRCGRSSRTCPSLNGIADALEPGLAVRSGLNSARLELRDRRLDRRLALRRVEALPAGAAKTMFSTPPCSEANSASIRSVAFCVSEPGISNSSRRLPPTVPTSTIRTR